MTESGCRPEDIDDQVSIPRALKGVAIAMLFSEGEPGIVRINLRGEGRTTVVEIAQRFGGGGHPQSAGVRVRNKPMREVIDMVVAAAQEHLAGGV
jgi:phosphoesterase RecJ-like protein